MQLLLDSSGPLLVCVLAEQGRVLRELRLPSASEEGRDIAQVLRRLMAQDELSGLSSIAAGVGPGSFIGTRQAISLANGIAAVLEVPVLAFDSVAALVPASAPQGSAGLRDARRGQLYLSLAAQEAQLLELENCLEQLGAASVPALYLELSAAANAAELQEHLQRFALQTGTQLVCVGGADAARMLMLAESAEPAPQDYIEPVYLRSFL